jgi:hypothetical protein
VLALLAAFFFALAFVFRLAGAPPESWLQPDALLLLGLCLLALHEAGVWGWVAARRHG